MSAYLANGPLEKKLMKFMGDRTSVPYEEAVEYFRETVEPEEFHAFIRKVSLGNGLESRTELVARQDGKKKEGKQ